MSARHGPPKHQNKFAWNPNAGHKKNEKELGGKLRPYSQITGVCPKCNEQIEWKRRYGKYKPLVEPAKCQKCTKREVRHAYHSICSGCAKDLNVCAKCCCSRRDQIVERDASEVEAERNALQEVEAQQKAVQEVINIACERDRRFLLRAMNSGKAISTTKLVQISDRIRKKEAKKEAALIGEYDDSSEEDSDNDLIYK